MPPITILRGDRQGTATRATNGGGQIQTLEEQVEVMCPFDLAEGGYFYFGESKERSPSRVQDIRRIVKFERMPNLRTLKQIRVATLSAPYNPPLHVRGMHGLGDNLHQRALVRQWLNAGNTVYLESSWVSVYHDLIPRGLHVIYKSSILRTQAKNALREQQLFSTETPPRQSRVKQIWYRANDIRLKGSVLAAMCQSAGCDIAQADFRLPIKEEWLQEALRLMHSWGAGASKSKSKPLMIFRPLVDRTEWSGCAARNPDHKAYAHLYNEIREKFFVVSVADLVPGKEWLVGYNADVDVTLHQGELTFEVLAALTSIAALTFCSPGFAVVLSQAVNTPVCCVFGGYESSPSFSYGAKFAPYLGIDPISPCNCFLHRHNCAKEIDLNLAMPRLKEFAEDAISNRPYIAYTDADTDADAGVHRSFLGSKDKAAAATSQGVDTATSVTALA